SKQRREKKAAEAFLGVFNARDAAIGERVLRNSPGMNAPSVKAFVLFFEKIGDFVDRSMSPEAAIELDRETLEPVSAYADEKLRGYLGSFAGTSEDLDYFRRIARDLERDYDVLCRGLSFAEIRGRSPTGSRRTVSDLVVR